MATLESPGVQVQVIDESFYTPAAPGTVPMIFVASAQDKTNPSGSIAQGTTAANAGKVWLITSQRDLTDTFGTPVFYTDASGNPQHGNELNEYGLQAAYSLLGASSRCYVVRAGVDLSSLLPTSSEPEGGPVAGTYWIDTGSSLFGVHEWNSETLKFTVKTPIVLDDGASSTELSAGVPTSSVGSIGDYCMVVTNANESTLYYKTGGNNWVNVVDGFDGGKAVLLQPHYNYPTWDNTVLTGSVWVKTTSPAQGANWSVKYYNGSTQDWTTVSAPIYTSVPAATYTLDNGKGGATVAAGSIFIETDWESTVDTAATFRIW